MTAPTPLTLSCTREGPDILLTLDAKDGKGWQVRLNESEAHSLWAALAEVMDMGTDALE